jgi:hypothetical protein
MENLKDPFIVDFPVKIKEFSSSLCKRLPEGNPLNSPKKRAY